MLDYIKSTNQKINQLVSEIANSSATDSEKRDMQHSLEKISIFSNDVFDEAKRNVEIKKSSNSENPIIKSLFIERKKIKSDLRQIYRRYDGSHYIMMLDNIEEYIVSRGDTGNVSDDELKHYLEIREGVFKLIKK